MRVVAAIEEPAAISAILRCLNLPTQAPTLHPARGPPQADFFDFP